MSEPVLLNTASPAPTLFNILLCYITQDVGTVGFVVRDEWHFSLLELESFY